MTNIDPVGHTVFIAWCIAVLSPAWIPVAFSAYWAREGRYSLKSLFVFVTVEAASLGIAVLVFPVLWLARE
jgi:hypothetical protein